MEDVRMAEYVVTQFLNEIEPVTGFRFWTRKTRDGLLNVSCDYTTSLTNQPATGMNVRDDLKAMVLKLKKSIDVDFDNIIAKINDAPDVPMMPA